MSREKQISEIAKIICNKANELNKNWYEYSPIFEQPSEIYAAELYNAGYRKQEWISVDERLPETRETILYFNGKWVDACYFDGDSFMTLDTYESDIIYEVTHWMPLPTPPKMKGGE